MLLSLLTLYFNHYYYYSCYYFYCHFYNPIWFSVLDLENVTLRLDLFLSLSIHYFFLIVFFFLEGGHLTLRDLLTLFLLYLKVKSGEEGILFLHAIYFLFIERGEVNSLDIGRLLWIFEFLNFWKIIRTGVHTRVIYLFICIDIYQEGFEEERRLSDINSRWRRGLHSKVFFFLSLPLPLPFIHSCFLAFLISIFFFGWRFGVGGWCMERTEVWIRGKVFMLGRVFGKDSWLIWWLVIFRRTYHIVVLGAGEFSFPLFFFPLYLIVRFKRMFDYMEREKCFNWRWSIVLIIFVPLQRWCWQELSNR